MILRLPFIAFICVVLCGNTAWSQTQIIAGWEEQVFPSYLLSTSTAKRGPLQLGENELGDPWGLLGVVVTADQDNSPIKVSIECPEFLELSEFSGTLPVGGQQYSVQPKVRYRFDRLSHCRQATPATLTFRVAQGDKPVEEITTVVTFRSINDCPFLWVDGEDVTLLGLNFAAYVNEQHPFVDKLLREALDIGVVDRFVGYQEGTPESVLRQVYALWDLMFWRDVRYSSITANSASTNLARSQHVRLIEETVNNTQANCVDGSVLFASMLRKIGIHSALILAPGHCYVGFWVDENKEHFLGLETTLVDSTEKHCKTPKLLSKSVPKDLRGDVSWPSFVDAVVIGTSNLEKGQAIEPSDPLQFTVIDIAQARAEGILPIPYSGNGEYLAINISDYDEEEWESDEEAYEEEEEYEDESDEDESDEEEYEEEWEEESDEDWESEEDD